MRAELDAIVLTFVVMIVSFAISQTAFFWVVETTIIAWLSTIIVVIGSIFWYYYCARIMNRFQWNDSRVVWDDLDSGDAWDGTYEPEKSTAEGYLCKRDISMRKDETSKSSSSAGTKSPAATSSSAKSNAAKSNKLDTIPEEDDVDERPPLKRRCALRGPSHFPATQLPDMQNGERGVFDSAVDDLIVLTRAARL